MTPIPLTETQMAELFRLRAENATLQTEIAELRIRMNAYQQAWNSDELEKSLSVENASLKEQVAHQKEQIAGLITANATLDAEWKKTTADKFAEMAEAIRLKDAALKHIASGVKANGCLTTANYCIDIADEALAIQPSPQILKHEIAELDALRNDAVLRLDKYRALCDRLGRVLEMMRGFYPEYCDSALEAWRALK